ncbi:hypothetical protein [Paenibacillus sp. BR1-192]|uniref:hypothetical protein n=1 Tax=Paenibacillus TaxID=44249 RepID=UPI00240E8A1E|nr:hypothetical protein [Paenibacillus sp. BR1-192]WFB60580.1 hypothetical protein P0X86_10405 [Paenibacillus sp. BR1-192]
MKKSLGLFALLLLLLVAVVGCGSAGSENKDLTLEKFIKAYQDAGIEVDPEEKPKLQSTEAIDGVIFYVDKQKVAIYEYESSKDIEGELAIYDVMKDWPRNGLFILETKNDKASEIFKNVK